MKNVCKDPSMKTREETLIHSAIPCPCPNIYQLLDEAEHDMKNYANRGGSYPPKPYSVEADNCPRGLHNSSYHAKAEFNNWFIIHSKYSQQTKNIENESLFNAIFHLNFSF